MRITKLSLLILLLLLSATVKSQNNNRVTKDKNAIYVPDTLKSNKVITNVQMIGVGTSEILDTYLSPETYRGTTATYISHTLRQREGKSWLCKIVHQGCFASVESRSGDGHEISGAYSFSYGLLHSWQLNNKHIKLYAGAQADVYAGFLYNTRNGNNPAQAKLSLNVSPTAAVDYHFRLFKRVAMLRYEASAPLIGLMFSPNYGQSYYEIFNKGNYDHNIVPVTTFSTPSLQQMLSLDFTLGRTTMRIGYLGNYRQAKVNNLKYHDYSHMIVFGLVRHFKITRIIP